MVRSWIRRLGNLMSGESVRRALNITVGAFIPLLLMRWVGNTSLGMELMLGTILVSGADIPESFKEKVKTLAGTSLLSCLLTLLVCMVAQQHWILIPVLFMAIFLLAYVAPFGYRYSVIAFMGFLAIIIALSTYKLYEDTPAILLHALHLLAGSLWYTIFALVIYSLTAKRQLVLEVAKAAKQTADYLQKRVSLYHQEEALSQGLLDLSDLQTTLTNTHVQLREFLLQDTSRLTISGSYQRRMLLVFAELLEMLEAALATPLDYQKWHDWIRRNPELKLIPEISQLQVKALQRLAGQLLGENKHPQSYLDTIYQQMEKLKVFLSNFLQHTAGDPEKEQVYHQAKRIQVYQEVQFKKLWSLEGIIRGELDQAEVSLDETAYYRFANARQITRNSIRSNFTFQSSYFRYALRTSVTAVAGYLLGNILALENAYWVLLTVLVVMKPGYAVTKQRFIHRLIGTVAGAAIAFGFYLLQPSDNISLAIFGISLFVAFSFAPHNYAIASVFFTIYVVFLYSFLHKEIPPMVLYRVADTTLGAVLCFVTLHYLWPSWEYRNFPYFMRQSLEANRELFFKIMTQLYQKAIEQTEYRLARKNAYVNMANLVSSFQRFKTEPKKKQKAAAEYGDSLLLNYTILSIISTIGVYMRRQPALLPELDVLKENFFRVNEHMEEVLDMIYHRQGAHLPAEGPSRRESEAWHHTRRKWMDFNEKDHAASSGNDVQFIREQLERLDDLVIRLKDQVQKLAPMKESAGSAAISSSAG